MLELRHVSKAFAGLAVIHDLDLAVERAKTTVVIGPSGCGKSTVLRLMLGLTAPDAGEVFFDDQPLSRADIRAVRRRVGYVIQDGGLFPHLTARQNVTLMARELARPPADIARRLDELVRLTNFPADALARYPVELSGGQRQRLALMRALMLDPDVLLMDEPLGALDPMIRFDLQADLRRIFRTLNKTVVIVTHDLAEAGYFADTIVLMKAGRIVQQGTLDDLTTTPADPFVTEFISAQRATHLQTSAREVS